MNYTFNRKYFFWALLLLAVELVIGFFIADDWIRPYVGDLLVVILLYCLLQSFVSISPYKALIGVLLFAYFIEMLQYFKFVALIGLQDIPIANILIGTSFSWFDLLMYTLGITLTSMIEIWRSHKNQLNHDNK